MDNVISHHPSSTVAAAASDTIKHVHKWTDSNSRIYSLALSIICFSAFCSTSTRTEHRIRSLAQQPSWSTVQQCPVSSANQQVYGNSATSVLCCLQVKSGRRSQNASGSDNETAAGHLRRHGCDLADLLQHLSGAQESFCANPVPGTHVDHLLRRSADASLRRVRVLAQGHEVSLGRDIWEREIR